MDHKLKDRTVCIAGLGYVGLPLALACLHATCRRNFLRKNLVKPSDILLRSSRIVALIADFVFDSFKRVMT